MSEGKAVLRCAEIDDAEGMADVVNLGAEGGEPSGWDVASFVQELRCAWAHSRVMQADNGGLVAVMVVWQVADEAHLLTIAVVPAWRRRGLARELLAHLRQWSTQRGLKKILLELRESNRTALRLYESCGFVINGRRTKYYAETDEDALLMEFVL